MDTKDNPFTKAAKEYIDKYISESRENEVFDMGLLEELRNYKPEGYMKDQKYFTPDIEDIKLGYELETCYLKPGWEKYIVTKENINWFLESWIGDAYDTEFRVPYLTKEQIESRGWVSAILQDLWVKVDGSKGVYGFKKNIEQGFNTGTNYELTYDERFYHVKIHIHNYGSWSMNNYDVFNGECKDINTFDYIMKLLKIPNDISGTKG